MKPIGFFRELEPSMPHAYNASLDEALRQATFYDRERVCLYLRSGYPVLDVMESTEDVVNKSFRVRGGSSILTDGESIWRADLESYVSTYQIALPDGFTSFVEDNELDAVPRVSREQLIDISLKVNKLLGFHPSPGADPSLDIS
ncbi:hypothetical protein [Streptomyces sp. PU-14G]|uniref:hypothetical protein n=1 Tax=Streptomyces sp. PU-14G TaxID=2800808 RepID=UPI0034DEBEAB